MRSPFRSVAIAALVAAAAVPFFAQAGVASAHEKKEAFGRLTVAQVNQMVASKSGYVFDDNSKDSYTQGHVPSAQWLAPDAVTASVLPADKNAKLVFYCHNEQCMACHQAATAALSLGYKNVFIMPAGIMGWKKAKLKVEA